VIEQKSKKSKAETIAPERTTSSVAKQQEVIDAIDDAFDDWSDKSESESESESEISGPEDDPQAISHETAELVDTDSELENKTSKLPRSQSTSKQGWAKIDIWRVSTEKSVSKKCKKKSQSTPIIEQHTPQECARHAIEQLNESNVHSVADALLLYPQQVSADAVCRHVNNLCQLSEVGLKLISSLFRSLVFVLPSEQGMLVYKSIILSLQHQNFSLLKTGDGPQYVLARKSILGVDSTENHSNQKVDHEIQQTVTAAEEVNALLDEGLEGLSDSNSDSDSEAEIENSPTDPVDLDPLSSLISDVIPVQVENPLATDPTQIDDLVTGVPSLSPNEKSKLTQFLTKVLISSACELVGPKCSHLISLPLEWIFFNSLLLDKAALLACECQQFERTWKCCWTHTIHCPIFI
jgi:hypothetical protein